MLIKSLETIIVLMLIITIFVLSINLINSFYSSYKEELLILRRFYEGRVLIKELTEKAPFSNGICNLTEDFFNILSNENLLYNYTKSLGIVDDYNIEVYYLLNNSKILSVGANPSSFIEMRRVCNFNNSLYLIVLRI